MLSHIPRMADLTGGISTIRKERLPGDPLPFRTEELYNRRDILDVRQATIQALALMEFDRFGRFLRVKECCSTRHGG
jgi:hypothetical protein